MKNKFTINSVGRNIPDYIEGYGETIPYKRELREIQSFNGHNEKIFRSNLNCTNKILKNIKEALHKCEIKDGMCISFHHHLREGDFILNMVIDEIAKLGVKDITIVPSSLAKVHDKLIEHIKNGVISNIHTSGLRGKLAKEISENNILGRPVVFRTHGGRARAIETGEIKIDIAFIAASACDEMGNMNGKVGKSAFGSMGYPKVDAMYANKVVAITDNLMDFPLQNPSITQNFVDHVVVVDEIGDPNKISSGATRMTKSPTELLIAEYAAEVIKKSGYVENNFSFQAGSGGSSLAVIKYLREYMQEKDIKGSFISGGITSVLVELLEEGLFNALLDTQTFDAKASMSMNRNANHIEMSASMYANPYNKGCVANKLDIMILSATEVDLNFNVNVLTGSTGVIMGAQGGHPDTAEGAKLRIVTTPLIRKRIPIVLDNVTTIVTPGHNIDVIVTERGIAINPNRQDLIEKLKDSNLPLKTMEELKEIAENLTGKPDKIEYDEEIVGIVEYRDGTIIDVIKKIKK